MERHRILRLYTTFTSKRTIIIRAQNNVASISIKLKTANLLGLLNVLKVFAYRIQCKTGYFERHLPKKQLANGPLFYVSDDCNCPDIPEQISKKIALKARQISNGQLIFFSHDLHQISSPPDWFFNPYNKKRYHHKSTYWTRANDPDFGDIKIIWEMSRMDWALVLAKKAAISQEKHHIQILNSWLSDWIDNNMPQTGPNWICAQEAAIRLIQILLCAHILNQNKPLPALIDFVEVHCQRIALTRHYANAQQNNHAISEAAGLFIGGMWLNAYSKKSDIANKWLHDGRQDLERLIQLLVANDGSFAQPSLNYHRVLISTMNMIEYFRQYFQAPSFSSQYYQKAYRAIFWIYQMINPTTGNGPNLGSNDGARVYALSETSYTDYRPEIQLGSCLFMQKRLYQSGDWDEPIRWLQLDPNKDQVDLEHRKSYFFSDGGYVTLTGKLNNTVNTWALVRCPNKRFRPHHADALHFDLWVNDVNVLRDSGSYSYNISDSIRSHFISSSAHNTVSFDLHDQMPVLKRFLYGQWIKVKTVQPITANQSGTLFWCGAYHDYKGCMHQRHIFLDKNKWQIIDNLSKFQNKATVRWRLMHDNWILDDNNCLAGSLIKLHIFTNTSTDIKQTKGMESIFYMHKSDIPVLEITVNQSPATVITQITLTHTNELL